jgi:urea transport system permease protein
MGFGGNNGLTDFKDLLGFPLQARGTKIALYLASVIALGLGLLLTRYVVATKLGRVMMAVRDAEPRVRFLGYSVTSVKLFAFVLSAMLAGLAGALYVPQIGIINPSEFSPGNSIEVAIWVAVGGRGTLVGAVVGAVAVSAAKTYLTGAFPQAWLYFLGGLFILVTLLMPKGLVGLGSLFPRIPRARSLAKEEKHA